MYVCVKARRGGSGGLETHNTNSKFHYKYSQINYGFYINVCSFIMNLFITRFCSKELSIQRRPIYCRWGNGARKTPFETQSSVFPPNNGVMVPASYSAGPGYDFCPYRLVWISFSLSSSKQWITTTFSKICDPLSSCHCTLYTIFATDKKSLNLTSTKHWFSPFY